jgi:Protein of unknown function (DUF2782)
MRPVLAGQIPTACKRALFRLMLGISVMLTLSACATRGGSADAPGIPADAVAAERVMDNGDVVTEYRVAGQLRIVKVQPLRGPAHYLQDRNGDGRMDDDSNVSPVYFKIFEW